MDATRLHLLAAPWWVNLAILEPAVAYLVWRRRGLAMGRGRLIVLAAWALAFAVVEAAVVVYLRGIYSVQSGLTATRADIARLSMHMDQPLAALPVDLVTIETWRETATMVMLAGVAWLAAGTWRERAAAWLWTFAIWDVGYYAGLWLAIGWPSSPLAPDVLFLIPVPWVSQVWFPILVSGLTVAVIARLSIRR